MKKQDRQGVRTPAQIEQKYNLGSEETAMSIASDAKRTADAASRKVDTLETQVNEVKTALHNTTEAGSYIGDGTFGSESQRSITFGFTPVAVLFSGGSVYLWGDDYINVNGTAATCTVSENTLSWYSDSAEAQLNAADITYRYVAIGKYEEVEEQE